MARSLSIHYSALFSGSLLHSSLQVTYMKRIWKEEWGNNQVEHPFTIRASWPFPVAGDFVQHWAQTLVKTLIYSHKKIHSGTSGYWPLWKSSTICIKVIAVHRDNTDFQTFHFQFLSYKALKIAAASSSFGVLTLLWYHFSWYHKKNQTNPKKLNIAHSGTSLIFFLQKNHFSPAYLTIHTCKTSFSLKQARKF